MNVLIKKLSSLAMCKIYNFKYVMYARAGFVKARYVYHEIGKILKCLKEFLDPLINQIFYY